MAVSPPLSGFWLLPLSYMQTIGRSEMKKRAPLFLLLIATLLLSGCASESTRSRAAFLLKDFSSDQKTLNSNQSQVLSLAQSLLGTPYRFGGTTPNGFDCSGYVSYVFKNAVGLSMPRMAREQAQEGEVVSDSLQMADLVVFRISKNDWHTGIYLDHGRFLHAPSRHGEVNIQDMRLPYWKKHFWGARRLL
jgi:cell wall-associated NlpC family hydrolase